MASSSGNWRSRASAGRDEGGPRSGGGGGGGGLRGDNWRGGGGGGGGSGDNWRGGGASSSGASARPSGDRPRLNLKPRGAGSSSNAPQTEKLSNLSTLDSKDQPAPTNSRAAAFGASAGGGSGGGGGFRRDNNNDRRTPAGPPPVTNSRFAKLAEEDRGRDDRGRDDRRGGGRRDNDPYSAPRGPPPPVNSRFAAAAEADRSSAPPPPARGPPPVANSRFAAAAAMAEQDNARRAAAGDDRPSFRDNDRPSFRDNDRPSFRDNDRPTFRDNRGPPPMANSRFSAAVAADADYMDRGERERRDRDQAERRMMGGGGRGGYGDRPGGRGGGFRMDDLPRGPRASQLDDLPKGPRASMDDPAFAVGTARVEELLKLPTEKKEQAPLEPISKEHEGNILQLPAKPLKKDEEELVLGAPKKEQALPAAPAPPPQPASNVNVQEYLDEFVSGNKLGEDLKAWTEENRANLPTPDKIIFHLLDKVEKLNPDPECPWAEPGKYGAALLVLCEDDIVNQMHVLWGIQFYCDKMGFPKVNEEYLVQSMFRTMYKYDLAEADAFMEWKEDETEAFEKGKLKAVIQTTEWFAWLEEEDDEEEEEEEDEYEEE